MLRIGEQDGFRPKNWPVEFTTNGATGPVLSGFLRASAILLHEQLYPEADVLLMGQTKAMLERVLLVTPEPIAQAAMGRVSLMAPPASLVGHSRAPTRPGRSCWLPAVASLCGSSPKDVTALTLMLPRPQLRLVSQTSA